MIGCESQWRHGILPSGDTVARKREATAAAAILVGCCALAGCLGVAAEAKPSVTPTDVLPVQTGSEAALSVSGYYGPTWADSPGPGGEGGVHLVADAQKKLPLLKSDFGERNDARSDAHQRPDWQLFAGQKGESLGFVFEWVTTDTEKYWSKVWASAGLAFNESWSSVDATEAKYLVLWARTDTPGVGINVGLKSESAAKGRETTGELKLADYASGAKLDQQWRRVAIPLLAFPGIEQFDLGSLNQLIWSLDGGFPENQRVAVMIDDIYLTATHTATPVINPGYQLSESGLALLWDTVAGDETSAFVITVDGKEASRVPGTRRQCVIPSGEFVGKAHAEIGIRAVGAGGESADHAFTVDVANVGTVSARVELSAPTHQISPYIFGANWVGGEELSQAGITVNRRGGNRMTKYNWEDDIDSAGADWFFLNGYGLKPGGSEQDKSYYKFVMQSHAAGAAVNLCIPIGAWVAKRHPQQGQRYCSFPIGKHPSQEQTDGQGCGNGMKPDGERLWVDHPGDTMVPNSVQLQEKFVETLVRHFGSAADGGVEFYSLDNEPGLWWDTHRDTAPEGITAEELAKLSVSYASAIKRADPTAKVIGFGAWGVMELAGSNADYMAAGPDGYKKPPQSSYRERKKHGGQSQLVYLLEAFKAAEAKTGKRLVDIIDIHWYPEIYGSDARGSKRRTVSDVPFDEGFAAVQFEALRELWDPTFELGARMSSWTSGENAEYLWDPYHPTIPALKRIIETHYPGTKLAINEYDFGSRSHFHGALLRAIALGVFMQQDLYMAQNWHQTGQEFPVYWAQKLYGNYDGEGSRVEGRFVPTSSSHRDLVTFAAQGSKRSTIIMINKNRRQRFEVTVNLAETKTRARSFTLSESLGLRLFEEQILPSGKELHVKVPPLSAVLVELS